VVAGRFRAAIIAALAAFFVSTAQAQQVLCFPEPLAPYLAESHGEHLLAQGITDAGFLMQIYVNDEVGGYTVILVPPDGRNCLLASGQAFMLVDRLKAKKKGDEN
tara:strand:- start:2977 stop:3291 length:315 start_codon:yes stop_codon:yes gene_type:complete